MKRISQYVLATIVGLAIGALASNCAHTTTGQFKDAVVTCTLQNSTNSQAISAVQFCLTGAIAGNYAGCLSGLVTAGQWTVEEVVCIVRNLATTAAQKLNAGDKSGENRLILDNANQFLKDNSIRFR